MRSQHGCRFRRRRRAARLLNGRDLRTPATVDGAFVEQTLAKNLRRFDKGASSSTTIGAAQVGARLRPDALYWLVRMLTAAPTALSRPASRMAVGYRPGRPARWISPMRRDLSGWPPEGELCSPGRRSSRWQRNQRCV
jgi:hypothetical protein